MIKSYAAVIKNNTCDTINNNSGVGNVNELVEKVSDLVEEKVKKYIRKELDDFKESMTKRMKEMGIEFSKR